MSCIFSAGDMVELIRIINVEGWPRMIAAVAKVLRFGKCDGNAVPYSVRKPDAVVR